MAHVAARPRPASLAVWWRAVRAFSFTASLVPVAVAAALLAARHADVTWWLLPLVALGALLVHAGTNYVSDAHDALRGVDRPGTRGGSGVIVEGLLEPRAVLTAGRLCLAGALLVGAPLVALRGWPLAAIGVLGVVGGYTYCGGPRGTKYLGLGDVAVFFLMGPLMVGGTTLALAGVLDAQIIALAVPIGLLVTAILAVNNLRDLDDDRAAGVITLAGRLGARGAAWHVVGLLVLAYVALVALVVARVAPPTVLVALMSAPLALGVLRDALAHAPGSPALDRIDQRAAQLHLGFGVLFTAGMLVGRWWWP